jgi:hypothetical protein
LPGDTASGMGTHMKTTIDIADPLFAAAQKAARERGTTFRALVELGLRQVLQQPVKGPRAFKLRAASFRGKGLSEEAAALGWDDIRELAYGERGR